MKENMQIASLLFVFLCSFFNAKSQSGHWDTLITRNQINDRSECGMAACNGKLYLIGGDGAAAVEVFDPVTLSWTKKSAAPVGMNHFEALSYNGKVYVLEAFTGGGFPNQLNLAKVYCYDTEKDVWQSGAGLPAERQRAAAGAAVYKGKLYLVDGITHGHTSGTNNLFDAYDPQTDTWIELPDAPHIRDHCEAAVVGDKLYVAGGRNTSFSDPDNKITFFSQTVLEVDCYDFKTGKWSTLPAKLPLGTGGGSMVNLDGILYYIGGERATATEQNAPRKNVFYLDPATNNPWTETGSLKFARNGMSAAVINHTIYAFGGSGGGPGGPMPNGTRPPGQQVPGNNPPPMPPPGGGPDGPRGFSPLEVFTVDKR